MGPLYLKIATCAHQGTQAAADLTGGLRLRERRSYREIRLYGLHVRHLGTRAPRRRAHCRLRIARRRAICRMRGDSKRLGFFSPAGSPRALAGLLGRPLPKLGRALLRGPASMSSVSHGRPGAGEPAARSCAASRARCASRRAGLVLIFLRRPLPHAPSLPTQPPTHREKTPFSSFFLFRAIGGQLS